MTDSFTGCQRASGHRANFLTQSNLIQTGHHVSGPLGSLSICSSITRISLFPFICPGSPFFFFFLSIMAHLNGLSLHLPLPSHPNSFTISRPPPSIHPSLFGNASKLPLPLSLSLSNSLSFCFPLPYPSVQTSVSKRLGVVCCAKPSAQIWITAVWRYV